MLRKPQNFYKLVTVQRKWPRVTVRVQKLMVRQAVTKFHQYLWEQNFTRNRNFAYPEPGGASRRSPIPSSLRSVFICLQSCLGLPNDL